MSVQYTQAREGYEFQITYAGRHVRSIKNKFIDSVQPQYRKCVPRSWVTQGYVEEVKQKKEV